MGCRPKWFSVTGGATLAKKISHSTPKFKLTGPITSGVPVSPHATGMHDIGGVAKSHTLPVTFSGPDSWVPVTYYRWRTKYDHATSI